MKKFAVAGVIVALLVVPALAQESPKPGPEHEVLKKMVGNWDTTMKMGGMDSKGTATYKMDLGGLWLTSELKSELFGEKYTGRGFDTYDAGKKKYVIVWIDSMSTGALLMEGTYNSAKKTMTLAGDGLGMDGKTTKYKSLTEMPDDNTINFTMYIGDGKEPTFTIVYKRKK